ncbi:hypothetical protein, partial [Cumulibacter manganitolerans]|uniref:hypothetical protein n=1 Tax=Cumulibacter manganitolerans TaxID=1884992 RepID=UPI001E5E79C2
DDPRAHDVPPPRPAPSTAPAGGTAPAPRTPRIPAEPGTVQQVPRAGQDAVPSAGQDAVPSAVGAARRATARLHGHFELVAADHARVWLPGRRPIALVLTIGAAGPRRPVVATRDGRTISIALSTAASTADIAAEVAGGVTAALLHDLDPSSFGADSVLTRDGTVTPRARLSRDDLRRIAVLQELLWQLEHTHGPLHDAVVRALDERIGQMGLDPAGGAAADARRGLLPPELRGALARTDRRRTSVPESGGGFTRSSQRLLFLAALRVPR